MSNINLKVAWGMVVSDEKLLFVKRSEQTTRPGQWCLPGGRIEKDESAYEACIREVNEEAGLDVEIDRLLIEDEIHAFYICTPSPAEQFVHLQPSECSDYVWVAPDDFTSVGDLMDFKRLQRIIALFQEVSSS